MLPFENDGSSTQKSHWARGLLRSAKKLEQGDIALDIEYLFLVNAPSTKPRWYHPSEQPTCATIPSHLVLHVGFEMAGAVLPVRGASSQQRQAVGLGAVILSEEDHAASVEELGRR